MTPNQFSALLLVAVAAVGCDRGVAPRPAWSLSAAAGTAVIEPQFAAATGGDMPLRPGLDLEVGQQQGGFGSVAQIAVDAAGRMYLLDESAPSIVVLSQAGEAERRLGSAGSGPGQISAAVTAIVVAESRLLLADSMLGRLTAWHLDDFTAEPIPLAEGQNLMADSRAMGSLGDDTVALAYWRPAMDDGGRVRVVRLGSDGDLLVELASVPLAQATLQIDGARTALPVPQGRAQMASADDVVYVTRGDLYEILALRPDGTQRWMLRADRTLLPMPPAELERAFDSVAGMMRAMGENPEIDRSAVADVPDFLPALEAIKADGRGRLWVFPYVQAPSGAQAAGGDRPVDVYDRDGTLLYSGSMPAGFAAALPRRSAWMAAAGEFVYGIEIDDNTGGQTLVRYRLELPAGS